MDRIEIDSAASFRGAVQAALEEAVASGARQIAFVDPDFDGWPLEEQAVLDALVAFARLPGRRVLLLARRFDIVQRRCPRFVDWRRTWGHVIDACRPVDDQTDLPTLLLVDRRLAVHVADRLRWRGQVLDGAARVQLWAEEVDAFAQRTEPAFAVTALGL